MFILGKIYNRRADLHAKYGGNIQSGIVSCPKFSMILLFTSPKGEEYGYSDGWISPSLFQYSGEGQFGDMELLRGNFAIKNHKQDGRKLHLFKKVDSGEYEYLGQFDYLNHKIIRGVDVDKLNRNMIQFTLKKVL